MPQPPQDSPTTTQETSEKSETSLRCLRAEVEVSIISARGAILQTNDVSWKLGTVTTHYDMFDSLHLNFAV